MTILQRNDVPPPAVDWLKIEYDQIHQYGRTIFDTIQRLAQLTFVINPALAGAYYFVLFEKKGQIVESVGGGGFKIFLATVAVLGVIYNFGALNVYLGSHHCLESLLSRMREIDQFVNIQTHEHMEVTAPHSYRNYWGGNNPRSVFDSDFFTRCFLLFLAILWTTAFAIAMIKAPGTPLPQSSLLVD
jgi:hypothetical protein